MDAEAYAHAPWDQSIGKARAADLEELDDDTQYYYRLKGTIWSNDFVYSDIGSFRTDRVTGVGDAQEDVLTIYPNPAEHDVTLISSRRMEGVEVLDAVGKPWWQCRCPGFPVWCPCVRMLPVFTICGLFMMAEPSCVNW